jgi:hypothetical protein
MITPQGLVIGGGVATSRIGDGGGVKRKMAGGNDKIFGGSVRIPGGRVRILGKMAGGSVWREEGRMAGGSVNRIEGQRIGEGGRDQRMLGHSPVSTVVVSMAAARLIAVADWCWVTNQNKEHRNKHFILK